MLSSLWFCAYSNRKTGSHFYGIRARGRPAHVLFVGFRGAGCRPVRQKSTCEGRAQGNAIMQKRGFYSRKMDNSACIRHSGTRRKKSIREMTHGAVGAIRGRIYPQLDRIPDADLAAAG